VAIKAENADKTGRICESVVALGASGDTEETGKLTRRSAVNPRTARQLGWFTVVVALATTSLAARSRVPSATAAHAHTSTT
jgi:hypothetical protein